MAGWTLKISFINTMTLIYKYKIKNSIGRISITKNYKEKINKKIKLQYKTNFEFF